MKEISPFVRVSLEMSDKERAKITEIEKKTHGQSSIRVMCLLNNLCTKVNSKYLEVGVYKGSTILAAMFDNPKLEAVGIEHFLYDDREPQKWAPEGYIWDNVKSQLQANFNKYRSHPEKINPKNFTLLEGDFREVDIKAKDKFTVCYFDIAPVSADIYDGFFEKILPTLAKESVVIFSQQSNSLQAQMLNDAFKRHEDKVELEFKEYRISNSMSDSKKYYSGIAVCGLKKKAVKNVTKKVSN